MECPEQSRPLPARLAAKSLLVPRPMPRMQWTGARSLTRCRLARVRLRSRPSPSPFASAPGQVLLAVGRAPETHALALQDAGVAVAPSGKIFAVDGQTSMDNVFAVVSSHRRCRPPCLTVAAAALLVSRRGMWWRGAPS